MAETPTQKEYWSGKVGGEWAAHAVQIDAMLAGVAQAALLRAGFKAGERVLDIGCGAGATSLEIARRVGASGSVLGVDLSPPLLAVARMRASGAAEFVEADATHFSADVAFDAAFSRFGVMFFEAPEAAFANIRSLLRPAGRLVFACWRAVTENDWATAPMIALAPMLGTPPVPPDADAPGPFAFADPKKVERILSGAGWRDIEIARWDDHIPVGGEGDLPKIADFLLHIGPCARALAEQGLDPAMAKARLIEHLEPLYRDGAVRLAAACWIVSATA
ncbi:MAG: methyltransferase domain-containing protein [Hyphomonadaceae bacterium]|nr:methyltransferase domain-containing protein [Hyphomonadaceae bacterium]